MLFSTVHFVSMSFLFKIYGLCAESFQLWSMSEEGIAPRIGHWFLRTIMYNCDMVEVLWRGDFLVLTLRSGEGCSRILKYAVGLLASSKGSFATFCQLASPLKHFESILNCGNIGHPFPFVEIGLDHGQECYHKVFLALGSSRYWHHRHWTEHILAHPNSHFHLFQKNHLGGGAEVAEVMHQSHEAFENLQDLLFFAAKFAPIYFVEEVGSGLRGLKKQPSGAVVYDFYSGHFSSCDVSTRSEDFSFSFWRIEDWLSEVEALQAYSKAILALVIEMPFRVAGGCPRAMSPISCHLAFEMVG